uniref:E-selectin n=1 Tax=Callorhinchus milii TaxID=7868 RepID=A0A4W3JCN7_CALMI
MASHRSYQSKGYLQRLRKLPQLLALVVFSYEILLLQGTHGWTYHYSNKPVRWAKARSYCQSHHTDIVAIQNPEENAYLKNTLPGQGEHYWIGLKKINDKWTWIATHRPVENFTLNWAPGEPNDKRLTEHCVEMQSIRSEFAGKWNDESCKKRKRPLCFEASCNATSCSGHGECVETINNFKCSCSEGFYGSYCEHVVKCERLANPDRGVVNCSKPYGEFSYNSTCDFGCVEGYEMTGTSKLQCTSTMAWTAPAPECTVVNCFTLEISNLDFMNCSHPLDRFSYNSTCTFSCREGYVIHGSDRLQCLSSGKWTAHNPFCEVQVCEALAVPDHSTMRCFHPIEDFSYNSTCAFSCQEGFVLKGLDTLHCRVSGEWTAPAPTCEAVKCDELKISHSLLMNCQHPFRPFSYNSTCAFNCKDGFILHGSDRLECKASSNWTAEIPSCKAVQCPLLKSPESGIINCSHAFGDFSYSSTCDFSCSKGFVLNGSDRLQCQASRLWTQETPSCEAVTCTTPGKLKHGFKNCSHPIGPYSYNSTCDFDCVEGYMLNGSNRLRCGAFGQWTALEPSCEAVNCEKLMVPDRGVMNCTHPITTFSYSSKCDFSCSEGFSLQGSDTLQCLSSGQWTAQNPTCKAVNCQTLVQPERGAVNCSHPIRDFSYTSTCDFTCAEGFSLQGSDTLQCLSSGQWTAQSPTCKAVNCQTLVQPERGAVNCSHPIRDFSYTSTCDFTCVEGFVLHGSGRLQCGASGYWTAEIPTCKAVNCEKLMVPDRGVMNCTHPITTFSYSSKCDFSCSEGFSLQGSDTLQCLSSGQWTAQNPTCKAVNCQTLVQPERGAVNCSHPIRDFSYTSTCDFTCVEGFVLHGSGRLQCGASGYWTAEIPTCKAVNCEKLMIPDRGVMNCTHPITTFSYSSKCDFSCSEGFSLQGSDTLQCLSSGQWTAQNPTCKVVNCQILSPPERSVMSCFHPIANFGYTSTCNLSCAVGFVLYGADRLKCGAAGEWTAQTPTCKAVTCQTLVQPDRGDMICSHPIKDFSYNSMCDFSCGEGFGLLGSDRLRCGADGQWTASVPTCKAVLCKVLTQPRQGTINCSHPIDYFSYNSTCDISCDEGFVLDGLGRLQCQVPGKWTVETPTCEAMKCEVLITHPPMIMNCTHSAANFSYGSACNFSCAQGYLLKGSARLQCNESGQWTDPLPTCNDDAGSYLANVMTYTAAVMAAILAALFTVMTAVSIRRHLKKKDKYIIKQDRMRRKN